jgi:hypothetical protein
MAPGVFSQGEPEGRSHRHLLWRPSNLVIAIMPEWI